jgi:DNA-binding NarL/FixJ family response regulator
MTGAKIKVLTVDDHPMLREGVVTRVQHQDDMMIVGEAENGEQALHSFRELKPDVTLMDLQMPGGGGLATIKAIKREFPDARIIVLTTYDGDGHAMAALKAGAAGYLLKTSLRKDLLDTIRAVYHGQHRVEPRVAQEILAHAAQDALSEREVDILRLVSEGKANKEIGRALSLSEDTVKAYMKSIFAKLNVNDRTHAVTVAARRGIIEI